MGDGRISNVNHAPKISYLAEAKSRAANSSVTELLNNPQKILKDIPKKELAKEMLIAEITDKLDLNEDFLKASIIKKDGKEFLVLTRPYGDKTRSDERYDFCNGAIKRKLCIKEGVLAKYNDLPDVTKRSEATAYYDNATMEKGKSLLIPLDALGQERYASNWFKKGSLAESVRTYQSVK